MSSTLDHHRTPGRGADPVAADIARSRHLLIRVASTQPTQFVDVTDRIAAFVARAGVATGLVNIQSLHTTAAVVVNEREPLLFTDFVDLLDQLAPAGRRYRHDDPLVRRVNLTPGERVNGHAHCRALVLGATACLSIAGGRLLLGRWQRVFLLELDGPQERSLAMTIAAA